MHSPTEANRLYSSNKSLIKPQTGSFSAVECPCWNSFSLGRRRSRWSWIYPQLNTPRPRLTLQRKSSCSKPQAVQEGEVVLLVLWLIPLAGAQSAGKRQDKSRYSGGKQKRSCSVTAAEQIAWKCPFLPWQLYQPWFWTCTERSSKQNAPWYFI